MNTYHRGSRGFPWQSHTTRKVCEPGARSVAGRSGTPHDTGVARSVELRHSKRGRNFIGVSHNVGTGEGVAHFAADL